MKIMESPICYGRCSRCDVPTVIFDSQFITVTEIQGEFTAIMRCAWCLGEIISDINEITAKYMSFRGVKVLSWEDGEIVIDMEHKDEE